MRKNLMKFDKKTNAAIRWSIVNVLSNAGLLYQGRPPHFAATGWQRNKPIIGAPNCRHHGAPIWLQAMLPQCCTAGNGRLNRRSQIVIKRVCVLSHCIRKGEGDRDEEILYLQSYMADASNCAFGLCFPVSFLNNANCSSVWNCLLIYSCARLLSWLIWLPFILPFLQPGHTTVIIGKCFV